MVILPPEFADAIRNDTDLDFMTFVNGVCRTVATSCELTS